MRVLVLSNGELKEHNIGTGLEDLQKIVGGYIEIPFISEKFFEHGIDMIINEEGKLIDGMNPEIAIVGKRGNILDIVYGNCIFASHDEEGETIGLNDMQIKIVNNELDTIVELMNKNTFKEFAVRMLFI